MRLTLLTWLIPILMLGVIGFQVYRVKTINQTPWKGGGFGMFSTNDHRPTRVAAIVLEVDGKDLVAELSEARSYLKEKFLGAPNKHSLDNFISRLKTLNWQIDNDGKLTDIKGAVNPGAIAVTPAKIKVSYYKLNFFRSGEIKPALELSQEASL